MNSNLSRGFIFLLNDDWRWWVTPPLSPGLPWVFSFLFGVWVWCFGSIWFHLLAPPESTAPNFLFPAGIFHGPLELHGQGETSLQIWADPGFSGSTGVSLGSQGHPRGRFHAPSRCFPHILPKNTRWKVEIQEPGPGMCSDLPNGPQLFPQSNCDDSVIRAGQSNLIPLLTGQPGLILPQYLLHSSRGSWNTCSGVGSG